LGTVAEELEEHLTTASSSSCEYTNTQGNSKKISGVVAFFINLLQTPKLGEVAPL
jgi:hypothetical protein